MKICEICGKQPFLYLTHNIEIQNNELTYIETINIYIELLNLVQEKFYSFEYNTKRIGFVDIEYVNNKFKTNIFIDYTKTNTKSTCTDCNTINNYWYWGWHLGTYLPAGDCINYDARTAIFNNLKSQVIVPLKLRPYVTNIVSINFNFFDYHGDYIYSQHQMYKNLQPKASVQYEPYIYPYNMVLQKNQSLSVFNLLKTNSEYVPAGKSYAGYCELRDGIYDDYWMDQQYWTVRYHSWKLYYGEDVSIPDPEI